MSRALSGASSPPPTGAAEAMGGTPSARRRDGAAADETWRGLFKRPLLPSGARDAALLQRQLKWLVAIRLVVVTSVFLLYFLISLLPDGTSGVLEPRVIFLLLGLAYGFSLGYIAFLGLERHPELQAYLQFVGDLLLITALVYWFGGASSPFTMLYLVVISVAAVLLRRRAALLVANVAYLLYAATRLALHFGWIPPAQAVEPAAPSLLYYNLAIHFLGFYGVAILTSYLARNVTLAERELAEERESLADLQVAYRDVVQSISAGLLTTDPQGRVTSVNRAGEQLLRHDGSWLVGRHAGEIGLLPPDSWGELVAACRRGERVRTEFEHGGTDGRAWYGFTMTALTDAHGRQGGYILIFQDLTEWRALQAELSIKERMAAVGELAAGLAHEIGNPLAAISGSVQLLAPGARELDPQRSQLLSIVLRESQRLDRTIKSFLQFARPKERESRWFDIAALLAEHVELLRNSPELSAAHEVALALDPPRARVMGDADQISQIFWNLARNAIKAMPGGGRLAISGRLADGTYQLRFADTGRGMSAAEREKLFQPFKSFFDEGSGLGMAIVYRIVQEHGGRLLVDSEPGQGSAITVELPAGQAPAGSPREGGRAPAELLAGGGRDVRSAP